MTDDSAAVTARLDALPPSTEPAVTLAWFLDEHTTAPVSFRGHTDSRFSRTLSAGIFPRHTVTPLGVFPLFRSAFAGNSEVYVGSYPGVSVVQTGAVDALNPLQFRARWAGVASAATEIVVGLRAGEGASFALWQAGTLQRLVIVHNGTLLEAEGIPLPWEAEIWVPRELPAPDSVPPTPAPSAPAAGHEASAAQWPRLPFSPEQLVDAVVRNLVGIPWSGADTPDVMVDGFALDGRREVRLPNLRTARPPYADANPPSSPVPDGPDGGAAGSSPAASTALGRMRGWFGRKDR